MRKLIYFPAISVGSLETAFRQDKKFQDVGFRFYRKGGSFIYYDKLLVSAGHTYNIKEYRKLCDIPSDTLLFGDSGGYQIATGKLKMKKSHTIEDVRRLIFEWLDTNCDVAMNLDVPPYVTGQGLGDISKEHFMECLNKSVQNYAYFNENQTGNTKFLNVIQGRSLEQISIWYNAVKDFEFQGWAIGGALNFVNNLIAIKILLDKGELQKSAAEYIHILGVSKPELLIYLAYLQVCLNKIGAEVQLTCDSSTPSTITKYGSMYLFAKPTGFSLFSIKRREYPDEILMPCKCPVCSKIDIQTFFKFDTFSYSLMCLHNIHMLIEYLDKIQAIMTFDNHELFADLFGMKVAKNLKIIDKVFTKGGSVQELIKFFKMPSIDLVSNTFEEFFEV